ncbi:MAG: hypothetical protein Q4D57_03885 [Clostridia bacterium]|nr:hypothetical protein [Clostridia bacterium]
MSEAILVKSGNVTKGYVDTNLNTKVDKVAGKGLSTNDYDNEAKAAVDALGTASTCDTGTSEGNVPVINANGKIDTSILPALAITDTFTAANESEMLALSADKGDVCIRTDLSKTYILKQTPASTLANWAEIVSPADAVQSVNNKTGVVTLNYSDVGAVGANSAITGATKTKITYDSKGLVTSGANLEASDIPDISATYETKSNKSDSYTVSSSTTYASTKALVDGLATKAEFVRYTATVTTSWTEEATGLYSQEISIEGISETDTPTIDLVLSDNVTTAKAQMDAWANISRVTTSTGKIKVYCYDTYPTVAIPIQLICIR